MPNRVLSTADMRVWTSSSPLSLLRPGEFQNITGTRDPQFTCMSRELFLGGMRAAGAAPAGALRNPPRDSEKSRFTCPMPGSRFDRNSRLSGAIIATSVPPECATAQLYSCASLTMMPLASFHPAGGAAMVDDAG